MKKTLTTLVVLSLIGGAAFAQTVTSANIVGYNKVTVNNGDYTLISSALLGTNNTLGTLLADVPVGTSVLSWNSGTQSYETVSKTRGGWGTAATNTLPQSGGVFVQLAGGSDFDIITSGDVPTNSTISIDTVNGLTLVSYPFPAPVAFSNTTIASSALVGDSVSFWQSGAYNTFSKTRGGWGANGATIIQPGQAFFYLTTTGKANAEAVPYNLAP